jgi:predicted methyltransferase
MMTKTFSTFVVLCAIGAVACDRAVETPSEPTTPTAAVAAVTAEAAPDIGAMLDAVLEGSHRSYEHRTRDRWRHPKETLLFFGLRPDMTVVEIYPGGGWYTEVLAPVLREQGRLVAAHYDPDLPPDYRERSFTDYVNKLAARPDLYGHVDVIELGTPDTLDLGEDGSADMVVTFRNIHGMINGDELDAMLAAMFRVLKPGGVLGVVQHRADEGADPVESARLGYVPESHVIERAEAAGFEFDARAEINANPADTKDHTRGVWALPPSLSGDMELRDEKIAIGESDRMTLRFIKPAQSME